MKFRLTGIAASLALAGAVHAADAPGFNDLDRNGDGRLGRAEAAGNASLAREFAKSDAGKLSRAEAAANPKVARKFAESDGDKDGFLSRTEYLKTAAAEDWRNARENMADFIRPDDKAKASPGSSQ